MEGLSLGPVRRARHAGSTGTVARAKEHAMQRAAAKGGTAKRMKILVHHGYCARVRGGIVLNAAAPHVGFGGRPRTATHSLGLLGRQARQSMACTRCPVPAQAGAAICRYDELGHACRLIRGVQRAGRPCSVAIGRRWRPRAGGVQSAGGASGVRVHRRVLKKSIKNGSWRLWRSAGSYSQRALGSQLSMEGLGQGLPQF